MKVKTDDSKIILTDLPLVSWLFGIVFSSVGLQVAIPSLLSASGVSVFGVLFGLTFVFAGYQAGLSAVYQKITIDRWLKKLTVRKIGLRHFSKTEYSAAEIDKFYSESETDSEDSKSYAICLTLKSGQTLALAKDFKDKAECEAVIKTAQTFLEQKDFSDERQISLFDYPAGKISSKRSRL